MGRRNVQTTLGKAGYGRPGQIHLPFRDVVTQVLSDMKSDVETKKMNVSLADSNTHFLVQGDRSRVVQILANLLSNAVKYSPAESSIEIDVNPYKEASEFLRINVRNH